MPRKQLTFPHPLKPAEDGRVVDLRRLVVAMNQLQERWRPNQSSNVVYPLTSERSLAIRALPILERMKSKGLQHVWAKYDSHKVEDLESRDPSDLIYFHGDVIKTLERCGDHWALGLSRGHLGVFPWEHTNTKPFLRALFDFTAASPDELSFVKGDVMPASSSRHQGWLTAYHDIDYGLVPENYFATVGEPSPNERARNCDYYYRYSPLRKDEIRLIRISEDHFQSISGCKAASIFLDLDHFPIHRAPPYTALSYCWGDPNAKEVVFCDGKPIEIPVNLCQALRWFFPENSSSSGVHGPGAGKEDKYLWADAICINQADVTEKNHQIPLMKSIYGSALEVLVYVNEADDGLMTIGSMAMIAQEAQSSPEWTVLPQSRISKNLATVDWQALQRFASQPAFRRSWIIQEIVLGAKVNLWYGSAEMDLRQIYDWIDATQNRHVRPADSNLGVVVETVESREELDRGVHHLYNLTKVKTSWTSKTPKDFVEVLRRFRSAQATDLRDKVYSLLSLASERYQHAITPDYSNSNTVANVYMQVARCASETDDVRGLLVNAGISQEVPGLPSWVPDWSFDPRDVINPEFYRCAGLSSRPDVRLLTSDPNKLIVRGAIVDKVITPCARWNRGKQPEFPDLPNIPDLIGGDIYCILINDFLTHMGRRAMGTSGKGYPNGDDLSTAVWQTLICGRGWGERRTDPADKRHYDAFLECYGGKTENFGWHAQAPKEEEGEGAGGGRSRSQSDDIARKAKLQEEFFPFFNTMVRFQAGRRTCITQKLYFGTLPDEAQSGDLIAVFSGFNVPFVLRRVGAGDGNEYKLVGHCFIHGIMDGELIEENAVEERGQQQLTGQPLPSLFHRHSLSPPRPSDSAALPAVSSTELKVKGAETINITLV